MTRKLIGALAMATLISGAAFAQAAEGQAGKEAAPKSGELGAQAQPGMQHELSGQVVKVDENTVYLKSNNAVIPLEINNDTKFSNVQKQDLKEGREIRASFTVEGQTTNVAKEIRASKAAPGMKEEKAAPKTPSSEPAQPKPPTGY